MTYFKFIRLLQAYAIQFLIHLCIS